MCIRDSDNAAAARLKKSYPVYDSCIIAAGTYPGQEEDVSTVGVKAVLLASDSVSAEVVEEDVYKRQVVIDAAFIRRLRWRIPTLPKMHWPYR